MHLLFLYLSRNCIMVTAIYYLASCEGDLSEVTLTPYHPYFPQPGGFKDLIEGGGRNLCARTG